MLYLILITLIFYSPSSSGGDPSHVGSRAPGISATSLSKYRKYKQGEHCALKSKIIGFQRDDNEDWVAALECGHQQHVRHKPPWMNRPWTETPDGRESRIGVELDCKRCDEQSEEHR